jgi:anaerobic magnesium-protoporphyrin IX monomethyl ester cyclase
MSASDNNTILLINPAGWQKESINLGLSYLAAALSGAGFSVTILDLNRYERDDASLLERVGQLKPFLVGISIKTATAQEGTRLSELLAAAAPEAVVVCGGPHMTLCPEDYMRHSPRVSYGIMGEGELANVALARAIHAGEDPSGIDGVVWRRGGEVVVNPWSPPSDLDSLRRPDLDVIEGFSWQDFRYPIVTSRGCPFGCIYCCVNKLTGSRKWRFRSPENVVDELVAVRDAKGITSFEIWDDNFTLDLVRAKAICRLMIARGLTLSWYCHNGIRADRIDLELAQLMKQAGCTSIAFGIESGNPATFDSINKGEPLSAVVNAVRIVKSVGIKAVGYFIIGLPGDTLERFIETVRFQRALKLDHYVFGMLIPYPHTEVWDIVKQRGVMFCDITQTQHFSDDIVPISFELPEFPKQDMVRAFYIAKYFDVLEAAQGFAGRAASKIVYLATPELLAGLGGMIIAGGVAVRHVVVGASEEAVRAMPAFTQVPAGTEVSFEPVLRPGLLDGGTVVVCHNLAIPREVIFGNCGLVLVDPARHLHQAVQVRRAVADVPLVPRVALSGVGVLLNLSRLLHAFGARKLWEVAQIQLVRPVVNRLPRQVPAWRGAVQRFRARARAKLLQKSEPKVPTANLGVVRMRERVLSQLLAAFRSMSEANRNRVLRVASLVVYAREVKRFVSVKVLLKAKQEQRTAYPYDEYSSYL